MAEDDKLSGEVAISVGLKDDGLNLKTKSRAIAALDRLIGAALDIPAAYLESPARKKRVNDEIDEQLRRAQAAIAEGEIAGRPELGGALIESVLIDRARKQKNVAGVVIETIEALNALPPPEEEADAAPQIDDGRQIDEDWMNQFTRYAEDASSEQLQQLWGRVLAGEINKKGTFSRPTLRFISELDADTAKECEWAASFMMDGYIPKRDEWNSGLSFARLIDLQYLGIIEGVSGFGPTRRYTIEDGGYVVVQHGRKALSILGEPGKEFSINAILITRLGREVFSLLPIDLDAQVLKDFAELIPKKHIRKIVFGAASPVPGGIFFHEEEFLWEAPTHSPKS